MVSRGFNHSTGVRPATERLAEINHKQVRRDKDTRRPGMKKLIVAPALAFVMSVATVTPAMAASYGGDMFSSHGIIAVLFGMFLPAVQ
jgi:hypothetical protein